MRALARIVAVLAFVLVGALALAPRAEADPISLITNGDFETGDLSGWTVTDQAGGSGSFFSSSALTTPLSGFPTVGAASGTYYAVSDQLNPGAHAMTQEFTVPSVACPVILSFDMFVNNQSGTFPGGVVDPAGLDFTVLPNQHARVDILADGAGALDTGAGVLQNLYLGIDATTNPHPYTHYSFDISATVGGGGTFQVRFAEVDNQGFFHQGVDNVAIVADCGEVQAASLQFGSIFFIVAQLELAPSSDGLLPRSELVEIDLGNGQVISFAPGDLSGSSLFATGATLSDGIVAQIWLIQIAPGRYLMILFGYGADSFDDDDILVAIGNDAFVPEGFVPPAPPLAPTTVSGGNVEPGEPGVAYER